MFILIKFLTIMSSVIIPSYGKYSFSTIQCLISFNILEAIFFDSSIYNKLLGFLVIYSLCNIPIKIWSILYFVWNVLFCLNYFHDIDNPLISAISHNLCCMLIVLFSYGESEYDLLYKWGCYRVGSIFTFSILNNNLILKDLKYLFNIIDNLNKN